VQREHDGTCISISHERNGGYRLMRTALSHLVFALAQMVQAIARRCDILAYGLCGFENWAPWEVGAEVVGVDSIVFI
jgi:hypothetical protein